MREYHVRLESEPVMGELDDRLRLVGLLDAQLREERRVMGLFPFTSERVLGVVFNLRATDAAAAAIDASRLFETALSSIPHSTLLERIEIGPYEDRGRNRTHDEVRAEVLADDPELRKAFYGA